MASNSLPGDRLVTESRAATPPGRALVLVDRFFPLVWVALYALLPVTGSGAEALVSSFDQVRDLEALRSVLEDGSAAAIDDNLIGPAYIATAAVIHWVGRLSPEDSLIALTRISYVLSVAGCLVLVRVLVRRFAAGSPSVSLPAQFSFVLLVFVAGTWHWSDVPWSHFYAAALAVAFYLLRLVPARHTLALSAVTGVVLALLALTRSFEFMGVVAGWAIAAGLFAIVRVRGVRTWRPAGLALGAAAFAVTTAAVYAVTGKRNSLLLYTSDEAQIYGDLRPEESVELPTFDFALVPVKVAQMFLDPCFYSLCELHEYAGIREAWRQPLAVQLPALVFLPLCVIVVAVLVVRAARRREQAREGARELRFLVELTVVASGLTLGYLSSSWASSTALRFGFARDFLLPFLLTGVVATVLAFAGLAQLSRRGSLRVSLGAASTATVALVAALLIPATVVARTAGLPRLESRHLAALEYRATCSGGRCTVEIAAENPRGEPVTLPGASMLTVGCGTAEPRFTLRVEDPTRGIRGSGDVPRPAGRRRLACGHGSSAEQRGAPHRRRGWLARRRDECVGEDARTREGPAVDP